MPRLNVGSYESKTVQCKGDSGLPPGLYPPKNGKTTSGNFKNWSSASHRRDSLKLAAFHQGQSSTPSAHPVPAMSQCTTYKGGVTDDSYSGKTASVASASRITTKPRTSSKSGKASKTSSKHAKTSSKHAKPTSKH